MPSRSSRDQPRRECRYAAVWSRAFVYVGICFGFFLLQLLIATLLDRARWRLYPKLFLLAPLYTIYFWGNLADDVRRRLSAGILPARSRPMAAHMRNANCERHPRRVRELPP